MSVESKPFYWIACDGDECHRRSPPADYEIVAWSDRDSAECSALDSEWMKMDDGRWYCEFCSMDVCLDCGAFDPDPYAGERDYLCRKCWAEQAAVEATDG